jgi:virulence-associated protein VagC
VPRPIHARLFWSGGSQAVRLPKAMRLQGVEVVVHRRGTALVLEPIDEADDWGSFWERLLPLEHRVARGKNRPEKKRAPI